MWNINQHTLKFNFQEHMLSIQDTPIKRSLIKYFASLYDPLGLLNPYIVKLEILFQKVCKVGISLDQTIPQELVCKWEQIFEDTMNCNVVVIKRWDANLGPACSLELHGFSDSSLQVYGCCVYIKIINLDGTVTTSLVSSTSRVSPMQNQTIPKLELIVTLLLSRLIIRVKFELSVSFNVDQVFYWSDSMVGLH